MTPSPRPLPRRGAGARHGAGIDLVLLTGFLGTGKTTLLRDLLGQPDGADTAVVVNEIGAIDLDGAILREAGASDLTMLANGCICCQAGSDLAVTLEGLLAADRPAGAPRLRRIVVETSGLSKPGPVLRQLAALAPYRLRVLVVATYDPTREPELSDYEEAAAQWAGAHRLVLTKTDLIAPDALRSARADAASINPLAAIVAEPDRAEAVRLAFAPPSGPEPAVLSSEHVGATSGGRHPRLATLLVRQDAPVAYNDLAAWLDNLAGALGERLLRLKGLVRVTGSARLLLVQCVGTTFAAPRPFGGPAPDDPFLVVIGRDLAAVEIDAVQPTGLLRCDRPAFRRVAATRRPARAEPV